MHRLLILPTVLISITISNAQTKVIAHRGNSSIAPENTLAAFRKAIESGADYMELDVHKTLDDTLVVIHDATINRTSSDNKKGRVSDMTYCELKEVNVGYSKKFEKQFENEKVPTLRECLILARDKIKVCIEIKELGIEENVLKIVNELGMHSNVIIFSFHYQVLAKIRQNDKTIPILYLVGKANNTTLEYANIIHVNAIGASGNTKVTRDLLDSIHANQMELWKWTVDDEAEMQALINMGIDGIITNFPEKAIKLISEK